MKAAPKRLTRQEAQQETRARLIDAALALIAEAGVGAASIRGICERAGFSQGAFYSNFANKDELLLALVTTHMARIAHSLVETTQGLGLDDSLTRLSEKLNALSKNPVLSRLIIEMNLHAQRDAAFAVRFAEVTRGYQQEFIGIAETLITRHNLKPRQSLAEIAETMMAIWFGSIVQRPETDASPAAQLQLSYLRLATGC